jgi:hypothetical protein
VVDPDRLSFFCKNKHLSSYDQIDSGWVKPMQGGDLLGIRAPQAVSKLIFFSLEILSNLLLELLVDLNKTEQKLQRLYKCSIFALRFLPILSGH